MFENKKYLCQTNEYYNSISDKESILMVIKIKNKYGLFDGTELYSTYELEETGYFQEHLDDWIVYDWESYTVVYNITKKEWLI